MKEIVETGLIKPTAPHEWAVSSNGFLFSVHVPIRPNGSIESGSAERQAEVTFSDLRQTVRAAEAELENVLLVQIFLTSLEHKPIVDEVYKRYFKEPYPVRACLAVSDLPTPGTIIEVLATTDCSN